MNSWYDTFKWNVFISTDFLFHRIQYSSTRLAWKIRLTYFSRSRSSSERGIVQHSPPPIRRSPKPQISPVHRSAIPISKMSRNSLSPTRSRHSRTRSRSPQSQPKVERVPSPGKQMLTRALVSYFAEVRSDSHWKKLLSEITYWIVISTKS